MQLERNQRRAAHLESTLLQDAGDDSGASEAEKPLQPLPAPVRQAPAGPAIQVESPNRPRVEPKREKLKEKRCGGGQGAPDESKAVKCAATMDEQLVAPNVDANGQQCDDSGWQQHVLHLEELPNSTVPVRGRCGFERGGGCGQRAAWAIKAAAAVSWWRE